MNSLIFEKFCPQCITAKPIRSFYAHHDECRSCYRTKAIPDIKTCTQCGEEKPIDEFHTKKKGTARHSECKRCFNRRSIESYRKHKPARLAYRREYQQRNRAKILDQDRASRLKRKTLVFEHYGNGKAACVCCGVDQMEFLTLDHVGAEGADHRRILKETQGGNGTGWYIYKWLIDNGLPPGYQVLCFSCNVGKHRSGVNKCPHQIEREALWQSFLDHAAMPIAA